MVLAFWGLGLFMGLSLWKLVPFIEQQRVVTIRLIAFNELARTVSQGKIQKWQDLPAAQRLKLESSPEVLALLDPGAKRIPMTLREYLEPRDYEAWTKANDVTKQEFADFPEFARLGGNPPRVSLERNQKPISLEDATKWQTLSWSTAKPLLQKLFATPDYRRATDDFKKKLISGVWSAAKLQAAGRLFR